MAGKAPTAAQVAAAEKAAATASAKAETKPTQANIAAAAKAEAKVDAYTAGKTVQEATKAASAAATSVKQEYAELASQHKAEVKLVTAEAKAEGIKGAALTGLLNTVKTENKTEAAGFNSYMGTQFNANDKIGTLNQFYNPGVTAGTGANAGKMVDAAGNVVEQLKTMTSGSYVDSTNFGGTVQQILQKADQVASEMGMPVGTITIDDQSNTGAPLSIVASIIAAREFGKTDDFQFKNSAIAKTVTNYLDYGSQYKGEDGKIAIPEDAIKGNLKAVKGYEGLFQVNYDSGQSGNINKATQVFKKNEDGTYTPLSVSTYRFDDAPEKSGLLSGLSTIASIAAFVTGNSWIQAASGVLGVANAIDQNNPLGLILSLAGTGNALGIEGIPNIPGEIGKALTDGLGLTLNAAQTAALGSSVIGAFSNKENPFLGAATGAAGSYLGSAWAASNGDMDLFSTLVSNGVDTGYVTQADVDSTMNGVKQQGMIEGVKAQIDAGTLTAEAGTQILQNSTYFPADYDYSKVWDLSSTDASQFGFDNLYDTGNYNDLKTLLGDQFTYGTGLSDQSAIDAWNAKYSSGGQFSDVTAENFFEKMSGTTTQAQVEELWADAIANGVVGDVFADPNFKYLQPAQETGLKSILAGLGITGAGAGTMVEYNADGTPTGNTSSAGGGSGGGGSGGGGGGGFDISDPTTYPWGTIAVTGLNWLGSYLNSESASDAAKSQAAAQVAAAQIAADAAKFRPVGVKTAFGESQFGFDPTTGYLKTAGYTLDPTIKAQQDKLIAESGGYLDQYLGADAATKPMGDTAQGLFSLGQGYLATTPQQQAEKYMAEQNALLDPGNAAELAALQNRLQAQGRLGLSMGGEGGLMSSNPEMAAYQNKLEMQKRQLAAAATQGGMDYAKFGAGLVGSGGQMLRDQYSTQSAAYQPYQTAIGGAQYLEGLGQNAMDLGVNLGKTATAANAQSGLLTSQGMTNAANITGQQAQQAGSTWGNLLQGAGNAYSQYQAQQQQAQQQQQYNQMLQAIIAGKSTGVQ